jgi:hypothetical protein
LQPAKASLTTKKSLYSLESRRRQGNSMELPLLDGLDLKDCIDSFCADHADSLHGVLTIPPVNVKTDYARTISSRERIGKLSLSPFY